MSPAAGAAGSAATSSAPAAGDPVHLGLPLWAWMQVAVLATLLVATFRYSLWRLILKTNPISGEANWGHSFCVPIIGLYFLYLNREDLFAAPIRPLMPGQYSSRQLISGAATLMAGAAACAGLSMIGVKGQLIVLCGGLAVWGAFSLVLNWGLGTLLFGLLVFTYGIYPGRNDFVTDFGDVVTLFGLVLMLCGWQIMRVAWFPIVFLVCAIPWPGLVYSRVASPLQRLAADMSVNIMNVLGVDARSAGTKIFIPTGVYGEPDHALNVAEACAGLRSLMTFISIAVAVAFLSNRPLWQKIIISLSAIPIAIFCNVLRVTGTGLLYRYGGPDWAEGFTHQFVGMVMLVPAFCMIMLVGWVLDHLFVEEVDATGALTGVIRRSADVVLPPTAPLTQAPQSTRRRMRADGGTV
jgi:exosortase